MQSEKKILFVEDEETILHMLAHAFSKAGYVDLFGLLGCRKVDDLVKSRIHHTLNAYHSIIPFFQQPDG